MSVALRFKFINGNTWEQAETVPSSCSETAARSILTGDAFGFVHVVITHGIYFRLVTLFSAFSYRLLPSIFGLCVLLSASSFLLLAFCVIEL